MEPARRPYATVKSVDPASRACQAERHRSRPTRSDGCCPDLPRYLSDTFLHLDLGYDGTYQKQRGAVSPEVIQALILEAAALISVTMLIADLLHARLDPQVRRLS